MEKPEKQEMYEHIRLPYDPWWTAGQQLVLAPEIMQTLTRFGPWRLQEQDGDEGSGILLLSGAPGTGKSRAARFAADAAVRLTGGRGNALIVHTEALFSEELGRSAKLVSELFAAVEVSASHNIKTVLIWDDAEGIFCSRQQVIDSRDPTDLLRVTTTLNEGFDRLVGVKNVVQIATGNFADVLDPAIVDRIDHVLTFALPTLAERMEIIRRRLTGHAGEGVVAELAAATEGWSGRRLAKIAMQAYLSSTAPTRRDLSAADYLRVVGLTPEIPRAEASVEYEAHANGTATAIGTEDTTCMRPLPSESLPADFPPPSRWSRLWPWSAKPPAFWNVPVSIE